MHGGLPWPGHVAETPENIAKLAVDLYKNEEFWQTCQTKGYMLLRQNFDKKRIIPLLLDRILQIKNDLRTHRLNNFVGSMLQHHQHSSTKYMAQWIAAKNQV